MSSLSTSPWCHLISLTSRSADLAISADLHTIGRKDRNNTPIKDSKLSATHCIITREKEKDGTWTYYLEDLSSNGTFHNGNKIGKEGKVLLADGDEIMLLSKAQVPEAVDTIGFRFVLTGIEAVQKRPNPEESETAKRTKVDPDSTEDLLCGICKRIVCEPVTALPCLHSFCGACYSDIMGDSQCPKCNKKVEKTKPNQTLSELAEKFLAAHPEKKQTEAELEAMRKRNKVGFNITTNSKEKPKEETKPQKSKISAKDWLAMTGVGRKPQDKDFDSLGSGSDSEKEEKKTIVKAKPAETFKPRSEKCQYCKKGKAEFCADPSKSKGAKCTLCSKVACESCVKSKKVLPMDKQRVLGIPQSAFSKNTYEQKVLKDYLAAQKITLVDVLKEMEKEKWKYFGKEVKQTDTVCEDCFGNVLNDLLYRYRVSVSKKLPKEIQERPDCWYGKECKTQTHNQDHAKKYNHICENLKKGKSKK